MNYLLDDQAVDLDRFLSGHHFVNLPLAIKLIMQMWTSLQKLTILSGRNYAKRASFTRAFLADYLFVMIKTAS